MYISTPRLVQIAGWGGVIVASTGFFLQYKLVDRIKSADYYRNALKMLRAHSGAIHYLGEPIKDRRIKFSDSENNYYDVNSARFCVPVKGPKDGGHYYFWAEKSNDNWSVVKAELELKSKPDQRLVIMKEKSYSCLNNIVSIMFVGTSKEKFFYHNTLLCLVKSLQNQNITIDLRNDSYVCGHLDSVDGFMNLSLSKAVYCDTQQNEFLFDNLFVQGRNIRYVHIPESTSIIDSIRNEVHKDNKKNCKPERVKSRKATKALKQHMETVAMLE